MKTLSADGSVGSPHVRVGHRQALYQRKAVPAEGAAFFCLGECRRDFQQRRTVSGAIKSSAERRLRPVMMTLVSTMLGALPLILSSGAGAEGRNAIDWVVFSGLALAAVFTLYLTPPLLYQALARFAKARVAETQQFSDELEHATQLEEQANY
ncbi:MAG: hypothetical protein AMS22_07200 [Thiotrichales bacterium SG8_50]|nr:MAG: hypothetical protein AMS22_07200 [Thiotrichales bacterium SG8_50]